MKSKMKFALMSFLAVLLFGTMFVACDDSDDLPDNVKNAFFAKYPDATNVEYAKDGDYYYFYFTNPPLFEEYTQYEAYFNKNSAAWLSTDTKIQKLDLPDAVTTAFDKSQYATGWTMRSIFWMSDPTYQESYLIRMVSNTSVTTTVADLHYKPDGTLISTQEITYLYPWLYNWGWGWNWW